MTTATKPGRPVNAVDFLMKEYVTGKPEQELLFCEEAENARIAEAVHTMREEAGLSQADLAKRIGTQKSAISRLEDADYQGHSLGMLKRIADVLGYRVNLSFSKIGSTGLQTAATAVQGRIADRPPMRPKTARPIASSGRWVSRAASSSVKTGVSCKGAPRTSAKQGKKK